MEQHPDAIRTKEGYVRVWKIGNNPRASDWNDEPEKIATPYAIIEEKKKSYVVVRMGWGYGKKRQKALPKGLFFLSKEDCEAEMQRQNRLEATPDDQP